MPGAEFDGSKRRCRRFELPEQQLGLGGQRLAEASQKVSPPPDVGKHLARLSHLAEPRGRGVEPRQPLPAALGRRKLFGWSALEENVFS